MEFKFQTKSKIVEALEFLLRLNTAFTHISSEKLIILDEDDEFIIEKMKEICDNECCYGEAGNSFNVK